MLDGLTPSLPTASATPNPADYYVYSPPELEIARDLLRKGLPAAPAIILLCGLVWGVHGALSAAYGVVIVLVNFMLAALFLAKAAKIGPTALMAAAMGGFVVRMAIVLVAVLAVKGASWISMPALLLTILVTHLGLLFWEMKNISATLAHPGLKPVRKGA